MRKAGSVEAVLTAASEESGARKKKERKCSCICEEGSARGEKAFQGSRCMRNAKCGKGAEVGRKRSKKAAETEGRTLRCAGVQLQVEA